MTQGIEQGVGATLVAVRNGPGARLRAAREAMGLTALDVAQQLRLNHEMIQRLEQDSYEIQIPLVFIKGYLRSYAGLVGLNPEQVLTEFAHLGIADPVRDVPDLGQSSQRKLSNFNAGAPKHRPGILWGSLAIFTCGMLAFMWVYHEQIPALNGSGNAAVTASTAASAEENELNAAIEAARNANAQAAAAAATPATPNNPVEAKNQTSPATSSATTPATTPGKVDAASLKSAAATTPNNTLTKSTPQSPSASASASSPASASPPPSSGSSDDEDDENAAPVKPMSSNAIKVPVTKREHIAKTHETMLF